MVKKKGIPSRTRNWTFIVYPKKEDLKKLGYDVNENYKYGEAPSNWRDILIDQHMPFVVSPLHDNDVDATGERKKPHYHVGVFFEGVKSFEQVKEITDSLTSPIPQKLGSVQGFIRYLVHLDNPDKYQYKKEDIKSYNGFDHEAYLMPSKTEKYQMIGEMIDYIEKNDIKEYYEFMLIARDIRPNDWFVLLCENCTYVIDRFISSRRNAEVEKEEKKSNQKD